MAALPVHVPTSILVGITTKTPKPRVESDPMFVSIRSGHDVEWFCADDTTRSLVVSFPRKGEKPGQDYNGSPFEASEFYVPAGGSVCSGPPLQTKFCGLCSRPPEPNAKVHKHYKYDVYEVDPKGNRTLLVDPIIIIIKP